MIELIAYLVKSILAGALLFGLYHFQMRKEPLHKLNRFYLLSSALLMLILPFVESIIPFQVFSESHKETLPILLLPEIVIYADRIVTPEQEEAFLSTAGMVYLLITISMLTGLIISLVKIAGFIRSTRKAVAISKHIFLIPDEVGSFSFLGRIFISKKYMNRPEMDSIIIHEKTHISQHHFIDILVLELLSRMFWFNPFFYLIKKALRETHEYLADQEVIRNGIESIDYQKILFNEISGNSQYILANNFNLLTKKRIMMLNKIKSKPIIRRIFAMIPLIVGMAIAISFVPIIGSSSAVAQTDQLLGEQININTEISQNMGETGYTIILPADTIKPKQVQKKPKTQKEEVDGETVFTVVENPPQFTGGEEARMNYMIKSIKYPEEARKKGIQGTVYVTFVIEKDGSVSGVKVLRGIGGGCDEEAVRVISGMPNWTPGTQRGKPVRVQFNMPLKFTLSNDKPKEGQK